MKTLKLIVLFALFISFTAKAQNFNLVGTALDFEGQTWIYLKSSTSKSKVDSAQIVNGKFSFKGKSKEGGSYATLYTANTINSISLWLEPNTTTINFKNGKPDKTIINGSAIQTAYQSISKKSDSIKKITTNLYILIPTLKGYDSIQNTFQEIVRLQQQSAELYKNYIKENFNSLLAASYLNDYVFNWEKEETKKLFNSMSPYLKKSFYGRSINKYLTSKSLEEGDKFVDFRLTNTEGRKTKLSNIKGVYILLDFWASWCGGCREEFAELISTYNLYKDKGFTVIGISLDAVKSDWLKAIKNDQLPWNNVFDPKEFDSKIAKTYVLNSLPRKFLIDKNGTIIAKIETINKLKERLGELYR